MWGNPARWYTLFGSSAEIWQALEATPKRTCWGMVTPNPNLSSRLGLPQVSGFRCAGVVGVVGISLPTACTPTPRGPVRTGGAGSIRTRFPDAAAGAVRPVVNGLS